MNGGITLAPLLTEIKVNINKFKTDMKTASDIGVTEANKISENFKNVRKVGEGLSNIGSKLTKAVTLPFVGLEGASAKWAMSFEDSVAKVSTIADTTQVPIGELRKGILKLSDDTGIASTEISNNVYDAISAGQKTGDAVNFVKNSTKLAKAGFAEAGQSLDILTTIMNSYGMKAEEVTKVSDILINTQNLGKVTVGELSVSMGKVIPTAKAYGVNLEQVASGYAIMTAKGIKSAETTTYMSSMLNELGKSGTKASDTVKQISGKSFQDLIASGKTVGDVLAMMDDYAKKNNLSLADLFGSAEAGKASLILSANAGKDFNEMLKSMNNTAGATDEAFKKVSNTTGEKLKKSLNKLKNEAIKFGDVIAPVIQNVANGISKLTKSLSSLSPEARKNVVVFGALIAAIGPVLGVIGKMITGFLNLKSALGGIKVAFGGAGAAAGAGAVGFGALATAALSIVGISAAVAGGIYLVGKNTKTMNTNCLKSKEELGKLGSVLKDFNGGISISANQMDNLNIKHKDWSKEVSPETQKALTEVSDKIQRLNFEIQNTNGLDGIITKPQIDSLMKRTDELFKGIQDRINAKVPETQKKLADVFKADDGKINENEQAVLDQLNRSHDKNIKELNKYENEIKEIWQRALNEKRDLKQEEIDKIQELTNKAGQIELKATVKNKKELEETEAQFNNRMQNADMETISKALKEKVKASEEQIKIEKKKYDDRIHIIEENIPRLTGKEREYAEQSLEKLKEDKEKSVRTQQEKYQGYLQEAMKKYPELINFIDTSNGKILDNQQQSDNKKLNEYMKNMEKMNGITQTGYYEIKDKVKNEMHGCYVEVDEKSGEIVGVWDNTTHQVYGNPIKPQSDIAKDLLNGERFQPIKAGYDEKKEAIKKNALEVACNKNYNLFDWIPTLWEGVRASISAMPIGVGGGASIIAKSFGNHYNGLSYVPFDGYMARLHKGERVLTAEENKNYGSNTTNSSNINVNFNAPIDSPIENVRRMKNMFKDMSLGY
ncbi:phage tail tape measure protein [Clostridium botulinum]|nr:phage tail tape measure protein [Clostridium botulinum]NFJ88496.1 phage tail tape measure protein [Clostridium botulinum]HDI3121688.1 phage tail tape measure protein [Clostridium botulinum]